MPAYTNGALKFATPVASLTYRIVGGADRTHTAEPTSRIALLGATRESRHRPVPADSFSPAATRRRAPGM